MTDATKPTKGEVLAAIDRERDQWETLLVEVGEARMLEPGVMGESRESYARLAEIVQMLPDDAITDPDRFPWLEGNALGPQIVSGEFFSHLHEEHEPEIR